MRLLALLGAAAAFLVVANATGPLKPSSAVVRRLQQLNAPPSPAFPRFVRGKTAAGSGAKPNKRYTHTMISKPQLTKDGELEKTPFPGYISDKGTTECFGLPAAMCKPCPLGGPSDFCQKATKACTDHFCYPLCRHITWRCSVDFGELVEESARKLEYEKALCHEFKAHGCAQMVKCCQEDQLNYDFVENGVYQRQYPDPLLPSAQCLSPSDERCSQCQASVKVSLKPGACDFPLVDGDEDARMPDPEEAAGEFIALRARLRRLRRQAPWEDKFTPPNEDSPHNQNEYRRAFDDPLSQETRHSFRPIEKVKTLESLGIEEGMKEPLCSPTNWPKGYTGCSQNKAFQERCSALLQKMEPELPAMEAEFTEKACQCLGCCPGGCYYEIIEEDIR